MSAAQPDALERALEPLQENLTLGQDGYYLLGKSIMESLDARGVMKHHAITRAGVPAHWAVKWARDDYGHALSQHGNYFLLTAAHEADGDLLIVDSFVFGSEDIVAGGARMLAHQVASKSRNIDRTSYQQARILTYQARERGEFRRDGKGFTRRRATVHEKAVFRRTLLSIGGRPEEDL